MQLNDIEQTGQIAALQNFVDYPDLAELKRLVSSNQSARLQSLPDFGDNPDLAELGKLLAEEKSQPFEFDLFELLGIY